MKIANCRCFTQHKAACGMQELAFIPLANKRVTRCCATALRSRRSSFLWTVSACTPCLSACAQNEAVLRQIEKLKGDQTAQEIASPGLVRLRRIQVHTALVLWIGPTSFQTGDGCLQAAKEQFAKVLRLVQLEQFRSARLELREGTASSLRKDLRDAQEIYPTVSLEVCYFRHRFFKYEPVAVRMHVR
jgi:hypothetical protein